MIEFHGVTKRFGTAQVLRGVQLHVRQGRVMGLIGPNGAGKTTLIKLLLGLAHPTAGEIRVAGQSIAGVDDYRSRIGYMPQIARFPENLTAAEVLAMLEGLRKGTTRDGRVSLDRELIDAFELEPHLNKPLRALSVRWRALS